MFGCQLLLLLAVGAACSGHLAHSISSILACTNHGSANPVSPTPSDSKDFWRQSLLLSTGCAGEPWSSWLQMTQQWASQAASSAKPDSLNISNRPTATTSNSKQHMFGCCSTVLARTAQSSWVVQRWQQAQQHTVPWVQQQQVLSWIQHRQRLQVPRWVADRCLQISSLLWPLMQQQTQQQPQQHELQEQQVSAGSLVFLQHIHAGTNNAALQQQLLLEPILHTAAERFLQELQGQLTTAGQTAHHDGGVTPAAAHRIRLLVQAAMDQLILKVGDVLTLGLSSAQQSVSYGGGQQAASSTDGDMVLCQQPNFQQLALCAGGAASFAAVNSISTGQVEPGCTASTDGLKQPSKANVLWSDLHADALPLIEEAVRQAFRTQTGPAVAWWKMVTKCAKVRGHRQPAACVQVGCIVTTHVECCRSLCWRCCSIWEYASDTRLRHGCGLPCRDAVSLQANLLAVRAAHLTQSINQCYTCSNEVQKKLMPAVH